MPTSQHLQNYINGQWRNSSANEFAEVINPATAESLGRVPADSTTDAAEAIEAAAAAFPEWRRTPPEDRIQFLFKLKDLLERNLEDLARQITLENGKTLAE